MERRWIERAADAAIRTSLIKRAAIRPGQSVKETFMRIRLKAPFFFQNHLYQPGDIVDLPEGVEGPHKSRTISQDQIDYGTDPSIDANRILGKVELEPLFDVMEDEMEAAAPDKPLLQIAPPSKS